MSMSETPRTLREVGYMQKGGNGLKIEGCHTSRTTTQDRGCLYCSFSLSFTPLETWHIIY